jgi:DNA-directed RNA polymerase specialized sigma24 family protein
VNEVKCGVDRKVESEQVLEYQRTRDPDLMEEIYTRRIPTMRYLAARHQYISDDVESELKCVFVRSVEKYRSGKRSFNTYFYTAVLNHIRNMVKGRKRKKRTVEDGRMNPESVFVRMDDKVDDTIDGGTYHDTIGSEDSDWSSNVDVRLIANLFNKRSWILADIFVDMVKGACTSSRRRQYSGVTAVIKGSTVEDTISEAVGLSKSMYSLVGYNVVSGMIDYCVEVSSKRCIEYIREVAAECIVA